MQHCQTIDSIRTLTRHWREQGEVVGFFPTMGNLHGGHLALVDEARALADRVVVSIFVNPTQFAPGEDFADYPRTFEADWAALIERGVDAVFAPSVDELYPDGPDLRTHVAVPELTEILCGASRSGHFTGMATVVTKLLNSVQPDLALFGRKDYQQLVIIRRIARDLAMPVRIVGGPIAREPSGLAMSSRNAYLSADEHARAPILYHTLCALAERLHNGVDSLAQWQAEGVAAIEAAGLRIDYLELRHAGDLRRPLAGDTQLVIPVAAYCGRARLIDNLRLSLSAPGLTQGAIDADA